MSNYPVPKTAAGRRLLQVMSTVPEGGREGLAYFVDAIETEARNLGYADRLDEHINGLCGDEIDRLKDEVVVAARLVVTDFLTRPASLAAHHVQSLDALRSALIALGPKDTWTHPTFGVFDISGTEDSASYHVDPSRPERLA